MKLFQKKKNNKGFSLVELIVVVAIMAVLLGVLVPTLVRHIETSKQSKDLDGIAEIRSAMEIALASEEFSDLTGTVTFTSGTVTITKDTAMDASLDKDYTNEVLENLATGENSFEFKCGSKKYKSVSIKFSVNNQHVKAFTVDGTDETEVK